MERRYRYTLESTDKNPRDRVQVTYETTAGSFTQAFARIERQMPDLWRIIELKELRR